jgi:hypothetical protein
LLSKAIPNSLKRIIAHASPPFSCGNLSAEGMREPDSSESQISCNLEQTSLATGTPLRGIE